MTDQTALVNQETRWGEIQAALLGLDGDQRQEARDVARDRVKRAYGKKPERADFEGHTLSEYPRWLSALIVTGLALIFTVATLASFFNVFTAGRDNFLTVMGDGPGVDIQAIVVGIAVPLLAEFLTIMSAFTARVMLKGRRGWQALMLLPMVLGVVVAVTANAHVTRPGDFFSWLLTLTPPLTAVFIALMAEPLILASLERRHANERAYQEALREWVQATAEPEKAAGWRAAYASALREKLIEVNSRGRGKTQREEVMATLSRAEWTALVLREMRADEWFDPDIGEDLLRPTTAPAAASGLLPPAAVPTTQDLTEIGEPIRGNGNRDS